MLILCGVLLLVMAIVKWRQWSAYVRRTWPFLSTWWYNCRTRRRLPRILAEVVTRGYSPLLRGINPREHDAHEGRRPIPYESFFYCPAELRHDVPRGQHGNRLDHMRPTNDGGLPLWVHRQWKATEASNAASTART